MLLRVSCELYFYVFILIEYESVYRIGVQNVIDTSHLNVSCDSGS